MEDWLAAMKAASTREFFEPGPLDQHDFLSNHHHWYATSHARPTYCNVCRDALSGVTSHGLSCEVCKCKVHKRCAAKAIPNCKWTTLATVGKDIIEDDDGNIIMPHQWMEGNLPVSSTCAICKKTCGSVLRLQDWRCLWCRTTVHTACRPQIKVLKCPLGSAHVSVIPPTSVHSIGVDEAWDIVKPHGSYSPLLVFVNSKSGDNQGVKFLRRFKQLLNPAQVFDLVSAGPGLGLRLFRHFDPFRILVCSGDGSVGWVLSEIDRLDMNKQCQLAVLPLGTGNDLARVLGWGSSCDDDAHLPQILERYESASTKMLDRWSIMVFEKAIALKTPKMSMSHGSELMLKEFEELINLQLQSIIETEDFDIVISSTKMLCESVNDFLARIVDHCGDEEQLNVKCDILRQKLDMLLETLKEENSGALAGDELIKTLNEIARKSASERPLDSVTNNLKSSIDKTEKDELNTKERRSSRVIPFSEKEALQCRANSLKRAVHNVIQHSEMLKPSDKRYSMQVDNLCVFTSSSSETSPWTSPVPPINIISPSVSTNHLTCISPLDLRRDSMDEYFFNDLSLPVPRQFADGSSRRSSEVIKEESVDGTESSTVDTSNVFPFCKDNKKSELKATNNITVDYDSKVSLCRLEYVKYSATEQREDGFGFIPFEVYERNMLRNQQTISEQATATAPSSSKSTASNNMLQVPQVVLPSLEIERPPPKHENVYVSDSITLIDTDPPVRLRYCCVNIRAFKSPYLLQEKSSSDEIPGEASDVLSAISNEECSVNSEILDKQLDSLSQIHVADIIQDLSNDRLGHIDSPETSDTTEALHDESLDDMSSVLGHDMFGALQDNTITEDTTTLCTDKPRKRSVKKKTVPRMESEESENPLQFGFENIVFEIDNRCDDQKASEPIKLCSLAQFVEGFDIARKSVKRPNRNKSASTKNTRHVNDSERHLDTIQIQIQGSSIDLSDVETIRNMAETETTTTTTDVRHISFDDSCKKDDGDEVSNRRSFVDWKHYTKVTVFVEPPSPEIKNDLRIQRINELRRHSSHSPSLTVKEYDKEKDRRHSGFNPNLLGLDSEHMRFLNCSPAATRRISCGSLFKPNETSHLGGSKSSLFAGSSLAFNFDRMEKLSKDDSDKEKSEKSKKLPIINPMVQLPSWPNVTGGTGFISKCLLANADTLCAAVSPLMDPDETLTEGYYEKCVMNNYFGIGIDAKISLDFHNKREEHPEKCRSRAKNYMWYGVLGSKQWLQKTYKNLEQRVQLECDGQRIPLPSLQGIVVLNIPSFMGGTNFWGSTKKDDFFLPPSFDDRILEVVAVFGSVQMAASRIINLQHHRIAQCQSVQINILGDEGVPIQVDGEAWVQPPGMIRIIHKNRVQMLCRNRSLEISLKTWQEKQRQHSISIAREQTSNVSESAINMDDGDLLSERETYLLLNYIECVSSLVKWVKFLIISHPSLEHDLYAVACRTADALEAIHPHGKFVEGPNLRTQLAEVATSSRQLYEDSCDLLRERGNHLILREDLESKLSVALANMEMELRKCNVHTCDDGRTRAYLHLLAPVDEPDSRKKSKPFWLRFRGNSTAAVSKCQSTTNSREAVCSWGTSEVVTWLEAMQLGEYVDSFVKNDIRGKELLVLGRRDLKDLGVTKVGHVKRILQAIKDLGGS
ncbi:hypothetical protein HA402_013120 [Bradysia odoriphaga]|nr:hypothetical protein HA402_013120 [Bradysia odoriphaga]